MSGLKTIMILGAGEGQLPLIRRAKESGWRTIVVSPKGDYPGFTWADSCFFCDISAQKTILKLAHKERVSAIATDQTDISVPTVLYVADRLDLPHIRCDSIDNFRLKSSMRSACKQHGLSSIPYCVTERLEDVLSFYESLPDGAVIVKPVDSQGSRGVQRASSRAEVLSAYDEAKKYSRSGQIIIERFIEGHEIEVDTVVRDDKIVCTLIGDVYNFSLENTFSAFQRSYPSELSPSIQESVRTLNAQVISAFGLHTGWTHGEYILTKDNELFLLEIGARGGGNLIGSDIIREMIGVSTDEMAFCTAIGDDSFFDRISLKDVFCAYRCFYLPKGEVISIKIADGLLDESFVVAHNLDRIHVGLKTHKNTDKTSRYTIVVKERSRDALNDRILELEKQIEIQVRTESGIQGVIWR